jgi:hypothetical protein
MVEGPARRGYDIPMNAAVTGLPRDDGDLDTGDMQ